MVLQLARATARAAAARRSVVRRPFARRVPFESVRRRRSGAQLHRLASSAGDLRPHGQALAASVLNGPSSLTLPPTANSLVRTPEGKKWSRSEVDQRFGTRIRSLSALLQKRTF